MTENAAEDGTAEPAVPFITRVRLKNYKSIAECDVRLGRLTILVGPNGSGKSNFLDALAFVARALQTTPGEAIDERGGITNVVRLTPMATNEFSVSIDINLPWDAKSDPSAPAHYEFTVTRDPRRPTSFLIASESCSISQDGREFSFRVINGQVTDETRSPASAQIPPDRLYLAFAGTQIFFEPLFRQLQRMQLYNFDPGVLRRPQQLSPGAILNHNGEHLVDVIGDLEDEGLGYKERIDSYLRAITSNAISVDRWLASGVYGTIKLRSSTEVKGREVAFDAQNMSDGTIRAAAVLAALFQPATRDDRVSLVAIEEPEIALHPAAAGVLFDALNEASGLVQVLATSQSADLLDREDLDTKVIRPVVMRGGLTYIGEVDNASREIANEKLYTLGELMRGNQLSPQPPDEAVPEA